MGQKIDLNISRAKDVNLNLTRDRSVNLSIRNGQGEGASNYNTLTNKPSINGVVLEGDKLDYELYLQHIMAEITEQDIDNIIFGGNF